MITSHIQVTNVTSRHIDTVGSIFWNTLYVCNVTSHLTGARVGMPRYRASVHMAPVGEAGGPSRTTTCRSRVTNSAELVTLQATAMIPLRVPRVVNPDCRTVLGCSCSLTGTDVSEPFDNVL